MTAIPSNGVSMRSIRIDNDVAYIPLTRGYEAMIDASDAPLMDKLTWYAVPNRNTVYACRSSSRDELGKQHVIYLHRFILGDPDGVLVDHINGNGLDNRRDNLRIATKSQNQHNSSIRKNNSSGYKGVHWRSDIGKWRAFINLNGKRHYLGNRDTAEDAHALYVDASSRLHGEFGKV